MENLQYLLQGAAWQESLLQAYRSLHITIQSILLAVGIGLTVVPLSVSGYPVLSASTVVTALVLTAVATLQAYSSRRFSGVVLARGKDVNWWHRKIIHEEQSVSPSTRYFTKFKIDQQRNRGDCEHLVGIFLAANKKQALTEDYIDILVGKGLAHTRRVIDVQLFVWIGRVWYLLLLLVWGGVLVAFIRDYIITSTQAGL